MKRPPAPGGTEGTAQNNLTHPHQSIQTHEIVFLDGMALGCIFWDSWSSKARFEPAREELHQLALVVWPCPLEAHQFIQEYAREAGLGSASTDVEETTA